MFLVISTTNIENNIKVLTYRNPLFSISKIIRLLLKYKGLLTASIVNEINLDSETKIDVEK